MLGAIGLGIGSMISFSDRFLGEALIFNIDLTHSSFLFTNVTSGDRSAKSFSLHDVTLTTYDAWMSLR